MYEYSIKLVGLVSKSKSDLNALMKLVLPTCQYYVPEDAGPTTIKVLYAVADLASLPFNLDAYSQTLEFWISAGSLIMFASSFKFLNQSE